jgi:hypothetical protein
MKLTRTIKSILPIAIIGLLSISASNATTEPSSTFVFDAANTTDTFSVRAKGWSDPAFGDLGWVHSSDWGRFNAVEGQTVVINMAAKTPGLHPGATVYYRGSTDTAEDNFIPDVALTQNATMAKWGASNDDTGEPLGDIVMKYVTHGYDADNNTAKTKMFIPISDGKSGTLKISFKAPYTGTYMFVVGGYNPAPTVANGIAHNVRVSVNVK